MDQIVGLADKAVVKAYITPALSAAKTVDSYLVSVKSVDEVAAVTVDEGSKLEDVNLPKEVTVTLVNGKKAQKAVTWDTKELEANLSKPGDYTVKGAVAGTKLEASVKVTVKAVAPAVENVSAITSKSLKVEFNKAVDDTKAVFEVKKDGFKVNYSTITFSADKKSATIELTSKITKGEYTVSVTGLSQDALTGSVTTQDETVANVEILSETAPLAADGKSATVGYKVVNQYGEDITKLTSLEKSAGGATADVDGLGKITLTPLAGTTFKEGDKVVITLIHTSTAKSVTKTVTISAASKVSDVSFGTLYNKDGKTINEDTDLSKDLFYLPVTVKDQYGNAVTDVKRLNGEASEVLLNNSNPTVLTFGAFEVVKINNVDTVVLPVTGVKDNKAAVGETFVTVIAKSNGKSAQTSVKVAEAVRSDVVNLQAPSSLVVENEDILFPISITDKEGKAITDLDVAKDAVKGVKVTSDNGTIVSVDGALYVKVDKDIVKENAPITVVVQSSTNKVATQTVIPKAIATPKVITGLTVTTQSVRPGKSLTVGYDKVKIEDQYGRVMSKESVAAALKAGYSIKANAGENTNLTLGKDTIAKVEDEIQVNAKAGVTSKVSENITFTLVNPKAEELKASAYSAKFSIVPDTEFASYEVADIGTVYYNGGILNDYAKDITVKAVTKDGQKVTLDAGKDYTVKSTVLTGLNDGKIDTTDADGVVFEDKATTAKAKLTITINGTGEEFVKEVTFSKEAPKATKVELVENDKAADYIAGEDVKIVTSADFNKAASFNLDELENLADIVVTDQYGVSVALDEDTEVATFVKAEDPKDNIATAAATLTLTKVSGDVTFANNGTTTAAVNEITAGAKFNARVNVSGVAGTVATVTAKQAYSVAAGE
jgi:methionine-rich copper-binding protein CopC